MYFRLCCHYSGKQLLAHTHTHTSGRDGEAALASSAAVLADGGAFANLALASDAAVLAVKDEEKSNRHPCGMHPHRVEHK